jgi:hypothetical protein
MATYTLNVDVRETGGNKIANASVFLNGTKVGATGPDGQVSIGGVVAGQYEFIVKADNHVDYVSTVWVPNKTGRLTWRGTLEAGDKITFDPSGEPSVGEVVGDTPPVGSGFINWNVRSRDLVPTQEIVPSGYLLRVATKAISSFSVDWTFSSTLVNRGLNAVFVVMTATSGATAGKGLKIALFPPELGYGAYIQAVGGQFAIADNNGNASLDLSPGDISIVISSPTSSFELITTTVNVSTASELTIRLTKASDPSGGLVSTKNASATDASGSPAIVKKKTSLLDNPEYIIPNSPDGRYFTTTQARLYIGNVFIDELNYVQFNLQSNKVPIWSYRARQFDAVANGRDIVQGQIGVNFVSEGYLAAVLMEYNRLTTQIDTNKSDYEKSLEDLQDRISSLEDQIVNEPDISDKYALSEGITAPFGPISSVDLRRQLEDLYSQRNQLLSTGGPSAVDYLNQYKQISDFTINGVDQFASNAVYTDVAFDILIEVGTKDFVEASQRTVTRKLEKCFLIGNEQVYDQSGNPLADGYSFLARRLR